MENNEKAKVDAIVKGEDKKDVSKPIELRRFKGYPNGRAELIAKLTEAEIFSTIISGNLKKG